MQIVQPEEGEEKYGLNRHGKKKTRQIVLTPSTSTLLPCPEQSVDWDTTKNLFIEGDNLEVLKLPQKSYANKVKMIYIDPPYNTGKEFIYPDRFQKNLDTYLKYAGQVDDKGPTNIPKNNEEISKNYTLIDDRGRYRELELRNTHREFGKHNRKNLYYPFYVDDSGEVQLEDRSGYSPVYPDWYDGFAGCWTWGVEKTKQKLDEVVAKKVKDNWKIYRKNYAFGEDGEATKQVKSIWTEKQFHIEKGQTAFNSLFDTKEKIFQSPKSVDTIRQLILMASNKGSIILDFFAGSATTADAVCRQNLYDGGNRRYVIVQLPEVCDSKSDAFKHDYHSITEIGIERCRRVANTIKEANQDYDGDLGFKLFKLATSNIRAWNPDRKDLEKSLLFHEDHLVEGRTEQDVLYELLLKRGVDLAVPIEEREVSGKTIYSIGYGVLFACLDASITKKQVEAIGQGIVEWFRELAPQNNGLADTHVFFRDSAFRDDISKTNMAAILEQNGITHVRSL